MSKQSLELVVERNHFYRDNFRRIVFVLLASIVLNIALGVGLIFMSNNRPQPIYFAATNNGDLVRLQPLTNPVMNAAQLKSWIARVAPQIYALDFLNYRQQLSSVEKYFTPFGWGNFLGAFNAELQKIIQNKYVTSAVVTGSPVVIAQGIIQNVYSWKVQLPLLVTYTKGDQQSTEKFVWTVVLQRMNNNESDQLLGISQIVQTVAQ